MANQSLKIEGRSIVELDLYGQHLEVRKPSLKTVTAMQEKLEASTESGKDTIAIFTDFLTEVGIPKDLIDEMEMDHLTQVVQVLCEGKKK